MGSCSSKSPSDKKAFSVLVIGVDNAGKTTLVHTIKGDLNPQIAPTIGQSAPVLKTFDGAQLKFLDLGGGNRIRGVWQNYYSDVYGVVYVVDSADPARLEESKAELEKAQAHDMVRGKPLLILANKQDAPSHMSEADVSLGMGLDKLAMTRHKIVPCVAKPANFGGKVDDRIWEGLRWLVSVIKTDFNILDARVKEEMEEFKRRETARRAAEAKALAEGTSDSKAAEADDTVYCTVCKEQPAVRRCQAAGWEAVCAACGDRLEAEYRGKAEAEASPAASPTPAAAPDEADDDPLTPVADVPEETLEEVPVKAPTPEPAKEENTPPAPLPGAVEG